MPARAGAARQTSTWPVALAAAEDDVTAQVLALALSAYLLPDRVPF
jgi:hypothetical protein